MSKGKHKKRSYSGLVADLRTANNEAQGYLNGVVSLRNEISTLQKENSMLREERYHNTHMINTYYMVIQKLVGYVTSV